MSASSPTALADAPAASRPAADAELATRLRVAVTGLDRQHRHKAPTDLLKQPEANR